MAMKHENNRPTVVTNVYMLVEIINRRKSFHINMLRNKLQMKGRNSFREVF